MKVKSDNEWKTNLATVQMIYRFLALRGDKRLGLNVLNPLFLW